MKKSKNLCNNDLSLSNKEKELKSLTWKYFWKRKRQEIWGARWGLLAFQMLLLFSASVAVNAYEQAGPGEAIIGLFLLSILLIEIVILATGALIFIFVGWLRANWKLATKDARKELKHAVRKGVKE